MSRWPAGWLASRLAGQLAGWPASHPRTRKDQKTYGQGPENTGKDQKGIGIFSLTRDFRIKDQRIPESR